MLTERAQRQVDRMLDEAETAIRLLDWGTIRDRAQAVLALDHENTDALAYLAAADHGLTMRSGGSEPGTTSPHANPPQAGEGIIRSPLPLGHHPGRRAVGPRTGEGGQHSPTSFVRGRYLVIRLLGEGGKKRVYLTHDAQLDRDVAFALLKTDGLDADSLTRLRREAQAMGRLGDHPHIVTVHDIGDENGQPYLVCQFMAGGSVEDLLQSANDHRLPIDQTLDIADQVCQALEHAHTRGVIHRDLKPGNVWLSASPHPNPPQAGEGASPTPLPLGHHPGRRGEAPRTGEGWQSTSIVKLGDFGLALSLDRSRLTQAGMMVGTVAYMAPEQATGTPPSQRSDLYSLGCMLYEMVCGRPPFVGDESVAIISQHLNTPPVAPSWHRPDVPLGLEALILRLIEKDPGKRPASAAEVRQALQSVATSPHPNPSMRTVGVKWQCWRLTSF